MPIISHEENKNNVYEKSTLPDSLKGQGDGNSQEGEKGEILIYEQQKAYEDEVERVVDMKGGQIPSKDID